MGFHSYFNLLDHQKSLPFQLWMVTFVILVLLEIKFTGYFEKIPCLLRWPYHFLLAIINFLLFEFLFPSFCLLSALKAQQHHFGFLNRVPVPYFFGFIFTLISLDWVYYYTHRLYHAVPWLWKIHRVHHTDPAVDVTTGFRFHPLEILITALVEAIFIFVLGLPVFGVFLFELCMGVSKLLNHSNIRIPSSLEKWLQPVILIPSLHRIHHSADPTQTHRNFGFIFSWWDRLLMTYQKPSGLKPDQLGLPLFQEIQSSRLKGLLLQPFLDSQGHFHLKNIIRGD